MPLLLVLVAAMTAEEEEEAEEEAEEEEVGQVDNTVPEAIGGVQLSRPFTILFPISFFSHIFHNVLGNERSGGGYNLTFPVVPQLPLD